MGMGQTVIVAGIGCRKGASVEQVGAAIDAALRDARLSAAQLEFIAIPIGKQHESGVGAAAKARGVTLLLIPQAALEAADCGTLTRSAPSMAAMNVQSVAEASALAAAGPVARLLGPRVSVGPVTCALAEGNAAASHFVAPRIGVDRAPP